LITKEVEIAQSTSGEDSGLDPPWPWSNACPSMVARVARGGSNQKCIIYGFFLVCSRILLASFYLSLERVFLVLST
jgi:hypothetical protein